MNAALDATPLTLTSGGLQRYVSELSLALAREFPDDTYRLLSDQPFEIPAGAPPNLLKGPKPEGSGRWWLYGLRRALRDTGAQVFHGTNFEVPYLGKTPAILTIHDLSPWRDKTWHNAADRVRSRTPWLLRLGRAHMILTVSEAVRKEAIDYFRLPADKVRAVPLAASNLFTPLANPGPPPTKPYFLFVGTLEPRKNLAMLIEAWRSTRDETGADLVIAGRRRPGFPPIPSIDGLRYPGEVEEAELPSLYTQALAFVYPSHYEGFGLPVLEAMQCGCPAITSMDPALTEVSGGAALHAGTPLELANALRSVAKNPDLRGEMRRDGLARAQSFSWQRTARATRETYAALV
jgi:glycosyltransferase involved in cell wall biosynthesis